MISPQVYTPDFHHIHPAAVDDDARGVVRRLREHGHSAFIVGGAVRDLLLRRTPKDFDIATSATPEEIRRIFRNSRIIGKRFRIAHVYFKNQKVIEVSTFRREVPKNGDDAIEIEAANNSWGDPHDDAVRRDLTINGLFLDPDDMTVVDYNAGMEDLQACRIRVIGDPRQRFTEDPIRMIRAIRHAARTGFLIEADTWQAICDLAKLLKDCNESRVRQEFVREFQEGAAARSVKMLHKSGILRYLLPDFSEFLDCLDSRPESKRIYWKLLRLLDKEGAKMDLPGTLIFATALGPAIVPKLLTVFSPDDRIELDLVQTDLVPYMLAVGVPKSLTEPLSQVLYAQPKLDKARKGGGIPGKLQQKSYFGLSMHLFALRHKAIGSWIPEEWERLVPASIGNLEALSDEREERDDRKDRSPAGRERPRKRRRGRRGGGDAAPKSEQPRATKPQSSPSKAQPAAADALKPQNAGDSAGTKRRRRRRGRRGGGAADSGNSGGNGGGDSAPN